MIRLRQRYWASWAGQARVRCASEVLLPVPPSERNQKCGHIARIVVNSAQSSLLEEQDRRDDDGGSDGNAGAIAL
jgi:hypothetical protein